MRRILIIISVLILGGVGFYFIREFRIDQQRQLAFETLQMETARMGSLTATVGATGVVRANQSATLTWETSGTVEGVFVRGGDVVETDQTLSNLLETSLPQNIILAKAELAAAEKSLDDLLNSTLQQAMALQNLENAEQALEDLYNPELQQALAMQAISNAEKAVELAQLRLRIYQSTASAADIDAAEAQVVLAQDALDKAKRDFEKYAGRPEDDVQRANFQNKLSTAQQQYDFAVRQYNALTGTAADTDIAVAQADIATAEAQLLNAQREWERVKDGPTDAQIALFEAQLADAQREWERLKDGPAPDDVAAAETRISANKATLATTDITAPFNGTVTTVNVQPGDQVNPGNLAFRVDDLSRLLVDVDVSEVDINRIAIGQDVSLTFDAVLDKEYMGKVVEVGIVGTNVQGVVSFQVTVELTDANDRVRPGMTAGVNIVVNELADVLLVPNRAVRIRDGQRVVFVMRDSGAQPEAVIVELGASSDTHSQVLSGALQVGDSIVLNPPNDFSSFFEGGPPGR